MHVLFEYPLRQQISIFTFITELTFGNVPIICGGNYYGQTYQKCWTYSSGSWKPSFNLPWPNKFYGLSLSPFRNSSQSLFMTGGFNGTSDVATVAVSKIIEHLKMDEKKK